MTEERAQEGFDHLQSAALEMIQAARAFLDVAEDLLADKDKVAEVVAMFGSVADVASRAARASGTGPSTRPGDDAGAPSRVQHISVS